MDRKKKDPPPCVIHYLLPFYYTGVGAIGMERTTNDTKKKLPKRKGHHQRNQQQNKKKKKPSSLLLVNERQCWITFINHILFFVITFDPSFLYCDNPHGKHHVFRYHS